MKENTTSAQAKTSNAFQKDWPETFSSTRAEDTQSVSRAPGKKPGDIAGDFTGTPLSDALPFMLLLITAYIVLKRTLGKKSRIV